MQVERTMLKSIRFIVSGERVRNRQVTYLWLRNSLSKGRVMPDDVIRIMRVTKDLSAEERPVSYQLVGEVMAHQGNDG